MKTLNDYLTYLEPLEMQVSIIYVYSFGCHKWFSGMRLPNGLFRIWPIVVLRGLASEAQHRGDAEVRLQGRRVAFAQDMGRLHILEGRTAMAC